MQVNVWKPGNVHGPKHVLPKQLGNKLDSESTLLANQIDVYIFLSLVVFCDWSEQNLNHKIVQVLTENGK